LHRLQSQGAFSLLGPPSPCLESGQDFPPPLAPGGVPHEIYFWTSRGSFRLHFRPVIFFSFRCLSLANFCLPPLASRSWVRLPPRLRPFPWDFPPSPLPGLAEQSSATSFKPELPFPSNLQSPPPFVVMGFDIFFFFDILPSYCALCSSSRRHSSPPTVDQAILSYKAFSCLFSPPPGVLAMIEPPTPPLLSQSPDL